MTAVTFLADQLLDAVSIFGFGGHLGLNVLAIGFDHDGFGVFESKDLSLPLVEVVVSPQPAKADTERPMTARVVRMDFMFGLGVVSFPAGK
jgi:hypothetical protein